jgi:hypothetical protein
MGLPNNSYYFIFECVCSARIRDLSSGRGHLGECYNLRWVPCTSVQAPLPKMTVKPIEFTDGRLRKIYEDDL